MTAFIEQMPQAPSGQVPTDLLAVSLVGRAPGGILARGVAILRGHRRRAGWTRPWDDVVVGLDRMAPPDPVLGPTLVPWRATQLRGKSAALRRRPARDRLLERARADSAA